MIAANQAVFRLLDNYCAARDVQLRNAGVPRWIQTDAATRPLLINGELVDLTFFSASKQICRIDFQVESYFCTIGFDNDQALPGLVDDSLSGAMLTLLLAELLPRPSATAAEVRNAVEVTDKAADLLYDGHDPVEIASLFPTIRVQRGTAVDLSDTWRIFFRLCLLDSRQTHSWIEVPLLNTLDSICDLAVVNVPYETLCRSIFDSDPSAMFLALYRCMEAIYAYSSAMKVVRSLSLGKTWMEVAAVLEDELNWHPREEGSLHELMKRTLTADSQAVFEALREKPPAGETLLSSAGKRIYRLRNSLVHYRSTQQRLDPKKVDWNKLCVAMANMVYDMYSGIFS